MGFLCILLPSAYPPLFLLHTVHLRPPLQQRPWPPLRSLLPVAAGGTCYQRRHAPRPQRTLAAHVAHMQEFIWSLAQQTVVVCWNRNGA